MVSSNAQENKHQQCDQNDGHPALIIKTGYFIEFHFSLHYFHCLFQSHDGNGIQIKLVFKIAIK